MLGGGYLFFLPSSVGKQSQLLLKPTEVELGLQVGVKFDNKSTDKIHNRPKWNQWINLILELNTTLLGLVVGVGGFS